MRVVLLNLTRLRLKITANISIYDCSRLNLRWKNLKIRFYFLRSGSLWSTRRRIFAQPRMGKSWKSRFASRRVDPGGDGSLPSLRGKPAPLSWCHLQRSMAAVCFPTADIYLLQMQARQKAVSIIFCWERHGSWKRPSRTTRPSWSRGTADCTSVPDNVYLP